MGCISGKAKIRISRAAKSEEITLTQLYKLFHGIGKTKRFNPNIPIYARSLKNGQFGPHLINTIIDMGTKPVVKITTASAKFLTLTYDHEVLLENNEWIAASDLQYHDVILTNGVTVCRECGGTNNIAASPTAKYYGLCHSCRYKGNRNPKWKGGKFTDCDGYVRLNSMWDHPRANPAGQVYEHIVVAEKMIGRSVAPYEIVHHLDGNKQNNHPDNLDILSSTAEHNKIHNHYKNLDGATSCNGGKICIIPKPDKIIKVESAGTERVYDIVMADPYRNFVANEIVVHNCGKTKSAIDYAAGIGVRRILIICPKHMRYGWQRQFKIHTPCHYNIFVPDKGSSKQKTEAIASHIKFCESRKEPYGIVLNYETMIRPPLSPVYEKRTNRMIRPGYLVTCSWDLLILDEAHRIKAPGGKASWNVLRISKKVDLQRYLSGTPMPHSPLDIYAQYRALDPSIYGTRYDYFKQRYCIMGGYQQKQVVQFINLDDLNERFFRIAHYMSTEDSDIDLPEDVNINVPCKLTAKATKIYAELNKEFITWVNESEVTAANALVKLLRLGQIAGGYVKLDDGKSKIIDNTKIETVIDLMSDMPTKENIVVFCRFENEILRAAEQIGKKLPDRKIGFICGFKNAPNDFIDSVWQATETDTLIVQVQAGAEGIDLTAAHFCIFLSKDFSLGRYRQCYKRVHRPGQTERTFFYHIIAENTVDEKIMRAIDTKQNIVDHILEELNPHYKKIN
jgi:hypothetical protein